MSNHNIYHTTSYYVWPSKGFGEPASIVHDLDEAIWLLYSFRKKDDSAYISVHYEDRSMKSGFFQEYIYDIPKENIKSILLKRIDGLLSEAEQLEEELNELDS